MTALETLQTATCGAARVIERNDLGVLRPGSTADVILCRGNPGNSLGALEQTDFVMRDGRILVDEL